MNRIFVRIVFLLLVLLAALSSAAFAERPAISSDRQTFDVFTMRYRLDGHVTVRYADRVITADHAQVSVATLEVWAQDNIALEDSSGIHFTGDDLYVEGPAHRATINGHADFRREGLRVTSDTATFSWDTKIAEFTGDVTRTLNGKEKRLSRFRYNVVTGEILSEEEHSPGGEGSK